MLTDSDLTKIGAVMGESLRVEVLPRLAAAENATAELNLAIRSIEFRLGDVQDDVSLVAKAVNRIERRLDAAGIPDDPYGDAESGAWR